MTDREEFETYWTNNLKLTAFGTQYHAAVKIEAEQAWQAAKASERAKWMLVAEATREIEKAIERNAAPINPIAALRDLSLDDRHITIDAGLMLSLFEALLEQKP